jgi:hypothetical protein
MRDEAQTIQGQDRPLTEVAVLQYLPCKPSTKHAGKVLDTDNVQ